MKTGYASLRPGAQAPPALGKKEMPQKGVSPLRRRPTLRALDQRHLLKKAGENFCADTAVKSPTNQNLKRPCKKQIFSPRRKKSEERTFLKGSLLLKY